MALLALRFVWAVIILLDRYDWLALFFSFFFFDSEYIFSLDCL